MNDDIQERAVASSVDHRGRRRVLIAGAVSALSMLLGISALVVALHQGQQDVTTAQDKQAATAQTLTDTVQKVKTFAQEIQESCDRKELSGPVCEKADKVAATPVVPSGARDGQDGQDGATGATGQSGSTGAQGEPGLPGATGPAGPSGAQGAAGIDGPAGPPGMSITGAQGVAGAPGKDGTPGKDGPSIVGPAGPVGPTGEPGPSGTPGVPGTPGTPGINATPLTGVDLVVNGVPASCARDGGTDSRPHFACTATIPAAVTPTPTTTSPPTPTATAPR